MNKKAVIGTAAGVAAGFAVYKMYKQGKFDGVSDSMHKFASKSKRDIKNAVAMGKNQVDYIKERAEHEMNKKRK